MARTIEPERVAFQVHEGIQIVGDALGAQNAPLVLLLHGGGQTRLSWSQTQRRLVEAGYRVISVDQRGHGESSWSPDKEYDLADYASDLGEVLRQLGDPRIVLVGASLGGMTSLLAAGSGMARSAAGIVLVDVVHRPNPEGASIIRSFMLHSKEGFASLEQAAEAIAAYMPHRQKPRRLDGLRRNLRQGTDGRWRWHWDPAFMMRTDGSHGMKYDREVLEQAAGRVRIPTLLIRGGRSEIVSEELAAEFLALCPAAREVVLPGATHMISGDDNAAFTATIVGFLQSLDPAVAGHGNGAEA